ncbi:MAG: cation:proton antiporter [Phycisphaerales bacterium]|nr:cation:proton antiporter [Phycisphaerales bacterium]
MFQNIFNEFAVIMLIAAGVGALGRLLRQPLIVSFIAVGVIAGPASLNLVTAEQEIDLLAKMGIAILLFLVGLRLDVGVIRRMGLVALSMGAAQVLITAVLAFFLCAALGMGRISSLYTAVALTFSSTIIIVKLLSDKREIDALHGRLAVGILIVQDLIVVLAMIALTALSAGVGEQVERPWLEALLVIAKGGAFLLAIAALARFILPRLAHYLARSPELLVLSAVAWALALATAADALGMSREVGAFLAGVSLASTPYREAISGRLVSLRDFLLLFFFISLGAGLDLNMKAPQWGAALALVAFVLLIKPLVLMLVLFLAGYRQRTALLTGLTGTQISEFSLILAALGQSLGHLGDSDVALITLVGLVTFGLSTYVILHSHQISARLAPLMHRFELKKPTREMAEDAAVPDQPDIIILGLGRYGRNIARRLRERGRRVLGVDFDPHIIHAWNAQGLWAEYGDAEDPEITSSLPLRSAQWVVAALPGLQANLAVLKTIRAHGFAGLIALTAHSHDDAHVLERAGADLVLLPFYDAAAEAVDRLTTAEPPRADQPAR